ncbi:MAG TPA: beta-propeller fold lactonase family protein [Terriglobales bacterium]|nr:beta-propeller fold lactonase family protein [Terriglobales bacterium]
MRTKILSWVTLAALSAMWLAGCSNNVSTHNAYVTLPTTNRLLAYRIRSNNGQLTQPFGGSFLTGDSPSSVAIHPNNRWVYVANAGENDISLFDVDSSSGALKEVLPRNPTALRPSSLAIDPGGAFLYVVNLGFNEVSSYSIDASTGALTQVAGSPVATGLSPAAIAVTPSGKYVYTPNTNANSISGYTVNGGALQPMAGSPFPAGRGPTAIAVDPAEHFIYVTNVADSTISVLAIDPATGILSNIVGSPFNVMQIDNTGTTTGAVSISVDPSGKLLYVANQIAGNVSFYGVTSVGIPVELTGSPFASGVGSNFVVADSIGHFLFVGNQNSHNISVYSFDTTSGALTLNSLVSTGTVGATSMTIAK